MRAKSQLIPVLSTVDGFGKSRRTKKKKLTTNCYIMKLNQSMKTLLPLAAFAGLTVSANAALTWTLTSEAPNSSSDHNGAIDAIVGDLLETDGSVAGEGAVGDAGRHVTASTFNGKISTSTANGGNGGDPNANNAGGYWTTDSFVEFDLDTTTNTLGYDISLINIIQRGDGSRPSINVAVSLRTVGGSFVEIHDTGAVGTASNVNEIELTEDNGAALLGSGIDGVRFDFGNPGLNWTWYREFDVEGTATVPEPSSAALLGLGGLALILRRRK